MLNPKLCRPIVGLAVGVMLGAVASPAAAAPTGPDATSTASTLASSIDRTLGDRSAGSYVDAAGKLVVNVTDAVTAASVTAAGATPRFVQRSGALMASTQTTLTKSLTTPGTAFAVDPISNQVVVSVDSTVTGAKLTAVKQLVDGLGAAARLETTSGTFSIKISGGDAIYGGGARCSLGFNVRNAAGADFFLTAGHCTDFATTWTDGTRTLGTVTGSSFPGNDYGIVRYTNASVTKAGAVGSQDITTAGTPAVGERVSRRGSTTQIRSGTVQALNATVNYAEGRVSGLIRTNVCAEPGDSGGSLYAGTRAYGLTSGGNGTCSSGGTTYFQPVTEALSVYGVSVF